jgi:hypothetical protein
MNRNFARGLFEDVSEKAGIFSKQSNASIQVVSELTNIEDE